MLPDVKWALAAVVFLGLMATPALCQYSVEQETAACQNDALNLCGPVIPDHAKIHACLVKYKAYLSPQCRAIVAPTKQRRRQKHS